MNPFWMWLRSHPTERLVLILVVLIAAGLLWELVNNHFHLPNQPAPSPSTSSSSGASSGISSSAPQPTGTPSAADIAAATGTVKSFLIALNSYHYDDTSSSLGERVHPLVTPKLYTAQFAQPSVPYGKHPELHEIDTPTVLSTTPEGFTPSGELGFLGKVQIDVKDDNSTSTTTSSYELFLTPSSGGWRINSYNSNG